MRELDDEALGWFARPLPWGSYGMLARASLSAPTLGAALKRWCRHHGLLTPDVTLAVTTSGDVASNRPPPHPPPRPPPPGRPAQALAPPPRPAPPRRHARRAHQRRRGQHRPHRTPPAR